MREVIQQVLITQRILTPNDLKELHHKYVLKELTADDFKK
jgi:hypothetical protein